MLTCYIVDDESHAIATLASYIQKVPGLELLGTTTNPLDALELIGSTIHPDITFLDVDMPQLSGIDLAGLISEHTAVIFTTAFPNYAVGAFEKAAADYLLKPISFERFLNSVKKVGALLQPGPFVAPNDHMFVKSNIKGKVIKINFKEIEYAESIKNYLLIFTCDEKLVTYLTMKELERALPEGQFLRVHKSYTVNINMIKAVSGTSVQLKSGVELPLGLIYKNTLQDYINEKLVQSAR